MPVVGASQRSNRDFLIKFGVDSGAVLLRQCRSRLTSIYQVNGFDLVQISMKKDLRFFGDCAPKKWPFGQLRVEAERL